MEKITMTARKVDVCVVGGSGAGLSAAIKAHDKGASVIILEKMASSGGCTKMAAGILGLDSPVQRRMVFQYDADQIFRDLMTVNH
jgi:fumarate reductase flavoprotein subunit